jgi:hypothetical protein
MDADGVRNAVDNCPGVPNPAQRDADADGIGDVCDDGDTDLDGVPDREDLCPAADLRPLDADADGVGDQCDNCPDVANDDQIDLDADGRGDACEDPADLDEDGVRVPDDNCEQAPNPDQADADADGRGDACDACPAAPDFSQRDTDGDGVGDACDPCPDVGGPIEDQVDRDADGLAACAGDCDDADPLVFPGAPERCNAADDDCDFRVDEDFAALGAACAAGVGACARPGVFICGPALAVICDAAPGAPGPEVCNDADDDCDGAVDDGIAGCCTPGESVACGSDVGECTAGVQVCDAQRNYGLCDGVGPAGEQCNGLDDDCDGTVDDGFDLSTDAANCGRCGRSCQAGQRCAAGDCVAGGELRNRLLDCGGVQRRLAPILTGANAGLRFELGCAPGPRTQALLYSRNAVGEDFDWPAVRAWVQGGGQLITEWSSSILAYNGLTGANVVGMANFTGGCTNTIVPRVQRNPADPFWQDNNYAAPVGGDGCGYPLPIAQMPGVVPLGGWNANDVSLAYLDFGQGRLWLVESDWQDTPDFEPDIDLTLSDALLGYMIAGGRTGARPGQCNNALDDDGDGYFDLDDRGCDTLLDAVEGDLAGGAPACSNAVDDDGNGAADYPFDAGCTHAADATERAPARPPACTNGVDDDLDGRVDFPADFDCAGAGGDSEDPPVRFLACANGLDDDGDFNLDYPSDASCESPLDPEEGVGVAGTACSNGLDDDGDGIVDLRDAGCMNAADDTEENANRVPQCANNVDDDRDGSTDYPNDLQCEARGDLCEFENIVACGLPAAVTTFAGVAVDLDPASLEGWSMCYSGGYRQSAALADLQAGCAGTWLLYGCRRVGSANLQVAAMAPRGDVLFPTGSDAAAAHSGNGVQWYFDGATSLGFAPAGVAVDRNTCDVGAALAERRLCWHADQNRMTVGYRCGANERLLDDTFERVIYTASP